MTARVDNALNKLRGQMAELKARLALPAYTNALTEQSQALGHFLERTLQTSEASDLLCQAGLEIPLTVLTRVLCEDLFLCFWIARSEEDAAEYCRAVDRESLRLLRIMLENQRGRIRDKSTKEDRTAEALQKLKGMNTDSFKIEQLADKLGLKKIYDIAYRWPSLYVHGKSFRAQLGEKAEGFFATVTALVSFVAAIILIADNRTLRNQATDADAVLRLVHIENLGGK